MKRLLLLMMGFTVIAGGCQDGSVPTQSDSPATLSEAGGADVASASTTSAVLPIDMRTIRFMPLYSLCNL